MILLLANFYGVLGGASGWFLLNLMYLFFGTWVTHKTILKGHGLNWLLLEVGIPLMTSSLIIILGWYLLHVDGFPFRNLIESLILLIATIFINYRLLPDSISEQISFAKLIKN